MSTPLPTNALCTRLEIKNYLNINQADSVYDNLVHEVIGRISTAFETYCGRKFTAQDYTEYHDGGVKTLFPNNYPVNSITTIKEDSDWLWGSGTTIDSTEYRIVDDRYIIYQGIFALGEQSIELVYNGGYSTIPSDLKQAAIEECGRKLMHRSDYDETVKTLGDGSVTYIEKDFLTQTLKTLEQYKWYAVM